MAMAECCQDLSPALERRLLHGVLEGRNKWRVASGRQLFDGVQEG